MDVSAFVLRLWQGFLFCKPIQRIFAQVQGAGWSQVPDPDRNLVKRTFQCGETR